MLTQSSREKVGYSNSVDWWSLGVTMFKLLTGYRPFSEENFTSFMDMAPTLRAKANMGASPEYAILFQQIPFPRAMSDNAVDIISRLLDVNEKTRLGSGPRGVAEIKEHPFFDNINWELLEQKHVEPPYKPTVKSSAMSDPHRYPTFDALLTDIGKTTWLTDIPDPEDQKFFAAWCVTHPCVPQSVPRPCSTVHWLPCFFIRSVQCPLINTPLPPFFLSCAGTTPRHRRFALSSASPRKWSSSTAPSKCGKCSGHTNNSRRTFPGGSTSLPHDAVTILVLLLALCGSSLEWPRLLALILLIFVPCCPACQITHTILQY